MGMPIFEEAGPDTFRGIDIMRAVRSFDPCLPCGVHMYLGKGKTIRQVHSPMFGEHGTMSVADRVERVEALLEQVEGLPDPAARDAALELVQACSTSTARGSRAWSATSPSATTARWPRRSPATSSSRTCCCCTGCTPCRWRQRVRGALAEVRPVPRVPRRERRAARRRGRRRAAADGGQLQRLPVVGDDAEARDRGGDPQGRARRAGRRRRGRGAPGADPARGLRRRVRRRCTPDAARGSGSSPGAAPRRARPRSSAASCAARRSRPSTGTCSTPSGARCMCACRPCSILFASERGEQGPLQARCRTAGCGSTTSS